MTTRIVKSDDGGGGGDAVQSVLWFIYLHFNFIKSHTMVSHFNKIILEDFNIWFYKMTSN